MSDNGINWWGMLTDPAYLADPHAELKRIRELGPVHHDAASDVWFILGHAEFQAFNTQATQRFTGWRSAATQRLTAFGQFGVEDLPDMDHVVPGLQLHG